MVIASVAILGAAFYQRADSNLRRIDYRNANFVFFWLAGRMVIDGQNPYDSALWLAAHEANGIAWRPNLIFPYPLPLAALAAPLGVLSLGTGYLVWQWVSELLLALVTWSLLARQRQSRHTRLLVPLILALLYFGPVFLSLQIGALGAFTLAVVALAIVTLETGRPLVAGLALSLTLLKPPQGLPIVVLISIWLLIRRESKALAGMGLGALGLLLLGMLIDPAWLSKFATAGQAVMGRTLGLQSNAFGFAYHVCGGRVACMWPVGGAAAALTLGGAAAYLWRRGIRLRPWEAFNLTLPAAFFATPYLWSYDQILYVIPIVWIIVRLTDRTRSYLAPFGFLGLIVASSFLALLSQAHTHSDLLSVLTTLVVLGACLGLGAQSSEVEP